MSNDSLTVRKGCNHCGALKSPEGGVVCKNCRLLYYENVPKEYNTLHVCIRCRNTRYLQNNHLCKLCIEIQSVIIERNPMITYSHVILDDGTIYNSEKHWKIELRGLTVILFNTDHGKTIHLPWERVKEAWIDQDETTDPKAYFGNVRQVKS